MVTVTEKQSKSKERQAEALSRARSNQSLSNYPAIYKGFQLLGIPESEIKPRENVFTYQAWKALGRYVRKGQHGVKVTTFIPIDSKEKDEKTGETKIKTSTRPRMTTVFHICQTEKAVSK